jgi:hypothetical protein
VYETANVMYAMEDVPMSERNNGHAVLPLAYPFKLVEEFWYNFVYYPSTNWERAFSFNPQFHFGSNTQDVAIEHHVLERVGSYGKQLGCLIDMLGVLADRLPAERLNRHEQYVLERFRELAQEVDVAVADYRGEGDALTPHAMERMLSELSALRHTNPTLYRRYAEQIEQTLATA